MFPLQKFKGILYIEKPVLNGGFQDFFIRKYKYSLDLFRKRRLLHICKSDILKTHIQHLFFDYTISI